MKPRMADINWIRDVYATPDPWAEPTRDCPDLDRLRAAAAAELPLEERNEVLNHALGCRYCFESWRLALELGARPLVPFWVHYLAILWKDLRLLAELPRRLLQSRFGRGISSYVGENWRSTGRWQLVALSVLVTALGVKAFWPGPAEFQSGIRRGGTGEMRGVDGAPLRTAEIVPRVADGDGLPREGFVLRWWAPPEAERFDVRVTTPEGEVVDGAAALTEARFRVSADKLRSVRAGTALSWTVTAHLPEGRLVKSPSFRARVE